ncbi:hypothetical protein GCM10027047_35820 [Rhodococcus aerolatus]
MTTSTSTPHSMVRLDIATGQPFAQLLEAFTAAVPPLDLPRLVEMVSNGGTWDDVTAAVDAAAPHDFVIFSSIDGRGMTQAAGARMSGFVAFEMGNPVIAERMARHDMDAMLYAPLRVLIREASDGTAVLVLDQPSTVFAGLDNDDINAVGRELDMKVARLLDALGVVAPPQLGT